MNKLIGSLSAVVMAACIPGNSPVRVLDIHPVDDECKEDKSLGIGGGLLDASGPGRFHLWFEIRNGMTGPSIEGLRGKELSTDEQNMFVGTEIALSYTSRDPVLTFEAERIPTWLTLPPESERSAFLPLIGPKAAAKLRDNITDPLADPKTVLIVKMELKGRTESGTPMSVNPVYFPITVFTSGVTCTDGAALDGCTPGANGEAFQCCVPGTGQTGCP